MTEASGKEKQEINWSNEAQSDILFLLCRIRADFTNLQSAIVRVSILTQAPPLEKYRMLRRRWRARRRRRSMQQRCGKCRRSWKELARNRNSHRGFRLCVQEPSISALDCGENRAMSFASAWIGLRPCSHWIKTRHPNDEQVRRLVKSRMDHWWDWLLKAEIRNSHRLFAQLGLWSRNSNQLWWERFVL